MATTRTGAIFLGVSLMFSGGAGALAHDSVDPLTAPIAAQYAQRWLGEEAPVRVFGNSWLVGFSGLSVGLIQTSAGLVLIDAAVPQSVPMLEAHVRSLGLKITDIKYILSTEPHWDHAGGLAALSRDSGATVIASAAGAEVLRAGKSGPDDPQAANLAKFPPVTRLRTIGDGQTLRLGKTVITAHATPGHTAGSMTWTWRSCEGSKCLNMVFGSSLNPVAADGYRFSDPAAAATVASFRRTFGVMRDLPCDVLISAHPDQSGGDARLARYRQQPSPNPFVDAGACRAYADKFNGVLDKRLADERAAQASGK
ncbi:subclass B3 metallo-beta-lactamase [Caulobacter segnis]